MKTSLKIITLTLALCIGSLCVSAQTNQEQSDSTVKTLYRVVKNDGAEYYGYILKDDGREIEMLTKTIGKIFISKAEIQSIKVIDETLVDDEGNMNYGDFRAKGPFTTRYYLSTNALPIEKGENYAMIHLYGPEVHFAVSDRLSLGVMSSWIASPIAVAAKYSFPSKSNTHFALGSIVGSSGFLGQGKGFGGLHWATITQGDRTSNFSISAGVAHISPTFFDSWNEDLGPKYSLISESYPDDLSNSYYSYWGYNNTLTSAVKELTQLDLSQSIKKTTTTLPVLSLAGITPVGKKASFIFDMMVFFSPNKRLVRDHVVEIHEDVTYFSYDTYSDVTEDVTIYETRLEKNGFAPTALIMPGMRFNGAHNKAFQVVLAGVITKDRYGDVYSFPVPMVSWLRQF